MQHNCYAMKPVRLTSHAKLQCIERGVSMDEIESTIRAGQWVPAKRGRRMYRRNFPFDATWSGKHYAVKQVAPVVKEEKGEFVVITVYSYYF